MKAYFYHIYKIIFLILLSSISNLYAHNLFNGGCKEHCGQKVKVISNKNKLKNIDDRINIESKNSCLTLQDPYYLKRKEVESIFL